MVVVKIPATYYINTTYYIWRKFEIHSLGEVGWPGLLGIIKSRSAIINSKPGLVPTLFSGVFFEYHIFIFIQSFRCFNEKYLMKYHNDNMK